MSRVIGLDLGSKTCGVAISDGTRFLARALTTIRFDTDDYDYCLDEVIALCEENKVNEIVIGLPRHMNGDIGIRGEISQDFGKVLEEEGFQVHYWDERLSTVQTERFLISADVKRKKRKQIIDQMSAVNILQGFLDRNRRG